jgi:hypothetical protein
MHVTHTAIAAAVLSVLVLSQGACSRDASSRGQGALPPDEATALLDKRVWLDHEPRTEGEQFHLLIFDRQHAMGVFQHRTVWKGNFEAFRYEAQKGRIDMKLPGSRSRVQTGFTVERVKRGQADVKLTLERSPRGPQVYYGYDFGGHDAESWLAARFGALGD